MNSQGEITWSDLRVDSWQSYIESEEQMERKFSDQPRLFTRETSTHGATCVKCGRVFTAPAQYRYRGSDGAPICRDARACAVRAEGK